MPEMYYGGLATRSGTMSEKPDIKYFPGEVERVPGKRKGTWMLIDKESGKQTFPIYVKRSKRVLIDPEDLGFNNTQPTRDQESIKRIVIISLHQQGFESGDPVETDIVTAIIADELGFKKGPNSGRNKALRVLRGLWSSGMVQLEGVIHPQSNRAMHQKWIFD